MWIEVNTRPMSSRSMPMDRAHASCRDGEGPSSQGLLLSQGQQDSARGGHRGGDRGRSLVSLAGLDEGHCGLEADLHHSCVGRASAPLRPLLAATSSQPCVYHSSPAGRGSLVPLHLLFLIYPQGFPTSFLCYCK